MESKVTFRTRGPRFSLRLRFHLEAKLSTSFQKCYVFTHYREPKVSNAFQGIIFHMCQDSGAVLAAMFLWAPRARNGTNFNPRHGHFGRRASESFSRLFNIVFPPGVGVWTPIPLKQNVGLCCVFCFCSKLLHNIRMRLLGSCAYVRL